MKVLEFDFDKYARTLCDDTCDQRWAAAGDIFDAEMDSSDDDSAAGNHQRQHDSSSDDDDAGDGVHRNQDHKEVVPENKGKFCQQRNRRINSRNVLDEEHLI